MRKAVIYNGISPESNCFPKHHLTNPQWMKHRELELCVEEEDDDVIICAEKDRKHLQEKRRIIM